MLCPACNYSNAPIRTECNGCGLTLIGGPPVAEPAPITGFDHMRPDGNALIWTGWTLAFLAVVCTIAGSLMSPVTQRYSYMDPEPNNLKFVLIWLGGGMFTLAVVAWGVGQIVRAISFLPGKEN